MTERRGGVALVNVDGRVLAIGGFNSGGLESQPLSSIEEFNPEEETWSMKSWTPFTMNEARGFMGYLVVPAHKICP